MRELISSEVEFVSGGFENGDYPGCGPGEVRTADGCRRVERVVVTAERPKTGDSYKDDMGNIMVNVRKEDAVHLLGGVAATGGAIGGANNAQLVPTVLYRRIGGALVALGTVVGGIVHFMFPENFSIPVGPEGDPPYMPPPMENFK